MLRDMRQLDVGLGNLPTWPWESAQTGNLHRQRRAMPMRTLWETSKLQFSTTSMNNSFLRYLMPSFRQLIAPVA